MRKYRVVEHLLNNGTKKWAVEAEYSVFSSRWETHSEYDTLEAAKKTYDIFIRYQDEAEGRKIKFTKVVFP